MRFRKSRAVMALIRVVGEPMSRKNPEAWVLEAAAAEVGR
jgi:hypothetical protein